MKIGLERHLYAPELNRALVMNRAGDVVATLPAPGCTSIRDARRALFGRVEPRRIVTASNVRDDNAEGAWSSLNRTVKAAYLLSPGNMLQIKSDARVAGGVLLPEGAAVLIDGRTLPASRLVLSTRLGTVPAR